jgi:hypothetical protein
MAEQLARFLIDRSNDLYFGGVRMTNEIRLDRYGRFLATVATVSMVFWAFGTFATGLKNGSDFLYGCRGTAAVVAPQAASSGAVSVR